MKRGQELPVAKGERYFVGARGGSRGLDLRPECLPDITQATYCSAWSLRDWEGVRADKRRRVLSGWSWPCGVLSIYRPGVGLPQLIERQGKAASGANMGSVAFVA